MVGISIPPVNHVERLWFLFSTFVILMDILGPLIFVTINYARSRNEMPLLYDCYFLTCIKLEINFAFVSLESDQTIKVRNHWTA